MRIPRSRGAVTGVLLIVLGAWAALAPLIGPSFDFTTDSTSTWIFTTETVWLSILPGVAAIVGGLILLTSANRATASFGGWLAVAAGAWLVVGDEITGYAVERAGEWEQVAAFEGLGAAIAALAAFALGRLAVRSVRDEELAREAELEADHEDADRPRRTRESGRFERDPEPVATSGNDTRMDTLTAADRVRDVSAERQSRGIFRRR
jgi:hypothetical protein